MNRTARIARPTVNAAVLADAHADLAPVAVAAREGLSLHLFAGSFVLYMVLSYILIVHLKFLYVDTVARTIHAWYVLWGNGAPHMAAIGFIWMPLPTLFQIPFMVHPVMGTSVIAGGLMSAICMAATTTAVDGSLRMMQLSNRVRWTLVALFALHPMILMYGANGMSEAMLMATAAFCSYFYVKWLNTRAITSLSLLSVSAAGAILTRYEGFALAAAAVALVLIAYTWDFFLERHARHHTFTDLGIHLEGVAITALGAPVYAAMIWVYANWIIMGDPFFFLRGTYSNAAQIAFAPREVIALRFDLGSTSVFALTRIFQIEAIFIPATLLAMLLLLRRRQVLKIGALLLPFSLLVFSWLTLFLGQSYGWFRFFIYAIPGATLAVGVIIQALGTQRLLARALVLLLLLGVLGSNLAAARAILNPRIGREEFAAVEALLEWKPVDASTTVEAKVAAWVRERVIDRDVLMDDFSGREIIRLTGTTHPFVLGVDRDFEEILTFPQGRVRYVLVPRPDNLGSLDAINRRYPGLFDGLAGFAELEQDWGEWRLFRVRARGG